MEKIMIVEDDSDIRSGVRILLEDQGFQIVEAINGEECIKKFDDTYSLLLVDLMMPGISGIETCKIIRSKSTVPILILTARSSDMDKMEGLTVGADDYLVKPFSYIELVARVKALIRRFKIYDDCVNNKIFTNKYMQVGNMKLSANNRNASVDGDLLDLTETEYKILLLFFRNPNKILSVEFIFETVWEEEYVYSLSNTVMVHIKNLRYKLNKAGADGGVIKTVWGKGYRFEV